MITLNDIVLNKTARAIFLHIAKLCEAAEENHLILNNNSDFMPLHVELLYNSTGGKVFSFSHYYKQNGDLVPDPDMTFLMNAEMPQFITPLTFQNALVYDEVCTMKGNKWMINDRRRLKDLVKFANVWMQNIKLQQELKIERRAA